MSRKKEIVREVDPSDLGKGPRREIFHLQIKPAHTEEVIISNLAETKTRKSGASRKTETELAKLAEARDIAGRIIKSENSVDWHKVPEPGPWTGRTIVEDQATEDVLVGAFPKKKPVSKPSFGQRLAAFFKRK